MLQCPHKHTRNFFPLENICLLGGKAMYELVGWAFKREILPLKGLGV